jgi:thiol:disulfide interchange protein DsbD
MTCNDKECIFPDPVYFKIDPVSGNVQTDGIPFTVEEGISGLPGSDQQILEPVTWELSTEKISDGLYKLNAVAHVQEGWYIYSQEVFGDGPMPTVVHFDTLEHVTLEGEATEEGPKMIEGMDPVFEVQVRKYKKEATFSQVLKVSDTSKDISGAIDFMTCNDESCIFPDPLPFKLNIEKGTASLGLVESDLKVSTASYKMENVDLNNPVISSADGDTDLRSTKGTSSLWKLFFLGFVGGLVALLTPCVFPMIPLTVSFFTKGSEDKAKGTSRAITYGAFIFLIYVAFSIPFHVAGSVNPEIFNEISTNPWLNIFFFVIFIIFAISFFGYFEITLPSSFVNKMDSNANKYGGLVGIFFMALTLALVSFSCTGPILGSLLAGAITSTGGAMQLTMGLAGFGLALALPFALFAMFPRWLNSLPSSGGWLNSVKVVLGFAEIALAFKFLSNADLVMHWGLIRYEVFMAIWILCALGIVIYLLGRIRFPHDSPLKKITPMRWGFTALFGIAAIYLMGGFRYLEENKTFTPLSLMSGLAPPVGYSWIYPKECPSNLNCYKDLDEGLAAAKASGKPVMLDFTGYACVNCRKMEEHVWPEQPVYDLINENYILISLYVDDKAELPEEQQGIYETSQGKRKQIITKGNKWSTIQTETFVNNSQPYYALLSPNGQLLTDPVPYTPDVEEYAAFLERGITAMQKVASN